MVANRRKLLEKSSVIDRKKINLAKLTDSMIDDESEVGLVSLGDGNYVYKRFAFNQIGLQTPRDITLEEWLEFGQMMTGIETAIQWVVGDWGVAGAEQINHWVSDEEAKSAEFDSKYVYLLKQTNYSYQTLRDYAWVAANVPVSIRIDTLSFSHHRVIASLHDDDGNPLVKDQQKWLSRAIEGNWSVEQLKQAMKKKRPALLANSPLANKKTRQVFNSMWRDLEQGRAVKREKIQHLRKWLDEVESGLE